MENIMEETLLAKGNVLIGHYYLHFLTLILVHPEGTLKTERVAFYCGDDGFGYWFEDDSFREV